jgi:hypothetical protein
VIQTKPSFVHHVRKHDHSRPTNARVTVNEAVSAMLALIVEESETVSE